MSARWRNELIAGCKGAAAAAPIVACFAVAKAATGWVAVVGWVGFFAGAAVLFWLGLRALVELWRADQEET